MRNESAISLLSFISPQLYSAIRRVPTAHLQRSRLRGNHHSLTVAQTPCPNPRISMATVAPSDQAQPAADPTVQYVVVRRDLMDIWPTGSVIAQAVHASVAAVWESRLDSTTVAYCSQSGNGDVVQDVQQQQGSSTQMHTVVLEAKNEAAILKLSDKLRDNDIKFVMWREQPENFVTALAARPYPRSEVKKLFNKYKLFK